MENQPVNLIDYKAYEGKWYSLYSIPTLLDKNWKQTIEYYMLVADDHFEVLTTYHKQGKSEESSVKSKLFFDEHKPDGDMKAQFVWPFKAGYWVIELADDYSYVVVGHPDKKYLFIMAREPKIDPELLKEIIERCREIGYDTGSLVSQDHEY
ncbi:lipocalin family protein [Pedobacter sp. Du54]|uniref:lipocalin family protein n=1 Tax=Pedobacter anseongensis TaxID=3133439 RepID=UPI0030AE7F9E